MWTTPNVLCTVRTKIKKVEISLVLAFLRWNSIQFFYIFTLVEYTILKLPKFGTPKLHDVGASNRRMTP